MKPNEPAVPDVAFVLGGGGALGANEVGMLRALFERDIRPGLVVGTSVGAINGAAVAAFPFPPMVDALTEIWVRLSGQSVFGGTLLTRFRTLAQTRTHLHTADTLRELMEQFLPATFEELPLPFHCVAASIERAAARWFSSGPLVPAILASSAVPGLLPPVEIDGEHLLDGGLVNSIPLGRAIELGARTIYVLQVGRIERPLRPPASPLEVAMVAFEIARRHRFAEDLARVPEGVTVHLLPTGESDDRRASGLGQLRYRDFSGIRDRMDRAYRATLAYLDERSIAGHSPA